MGAHGYRDGQRLAAARWKAASSALPAVARVDAPYVGKDGRTGSRAYPFCLPAAHAHHNLLPGVRDAAITLFAELGIPWHAGIEGGPSNHLLSSQVQCVNALMPMLTDASRIKRSFGGVLDVDEVLEVEPGRFLTFEYIGPTDFFGESRGRPRVRGAQCTSVDAAFLYRTAAGTTELALVEWKYVEDYRNPRRPEPGKDAVRRGRYHAAWIDPHGPVRPDMLAFEDVLDEPFYQLVRQQLLAHKLESAHVLGADRVRVVHVHPAGNDAYQESLVRDTHRALGGTVDEVWHQLLREQDRFIVLESEAFLDAEVTSPEYARRYADDVAFSAEDLFAITGASNDDTLTFQMFEYDDGAVRVDPDAGVEVWMNGEYEDLEYPFRVSQLRTLARKMEHDADKATAERGGIA